MLSASAVEGLSRKIKGLGLLLLLEVVVVAAAASVVLVGVVALAGVTLGGVSCGSSSIFITLCMCELYSNCQTVCTSGISISSSKSNAESIDLARMKLQMYSWIQTTQHTPAIALQTVVLWGIPS